ncbi:hypothetical protein BDQ12DRAFT_681968, partial [Crucibulum laeve]
MPRKGAVELFVNASISSFLFRDLIIDNLSTDNELPSSFMMVSLYYLVTISLFFIGLRI